MADVRWPDGGPNTRGGRRDRGQLLLVAAFGLAVMLVALALILNTAIFTENIATRSSDIIGGKDAAQYRAATSEGIGGLVTYANEHNNSSYTNVQDAVSDGVADWSELSGSSQALDGRSTNLSLVRQSRGTRIYQHSYDDFGDDDDADDWTLIQDADGVRKFEMTVAELTLPTTGNAFHVNISETSGDDWRRVYLSSNLAGEVTVDVSDGSSNRTCTEPAGDGVANVSITGASLEGSGCSALGWLTALDPPLTISYVDATIDGTYSLVANSTNYASNHYDDTTTAPYVSPAIYSVAVDATYDGQRLSYRSRIRVAPGEFDD